MSRLTKVTLLVALFSVLLAPGCIKDEVSRSDAANTYSGDVAVVWFEYMRELTKVCPGFSPPVASRAFGYAGVALYESVAPGMPLNKSLAGTLNQLLTLPKTESGKLYHWPTSANAALAYMAKNLWANMPAANFAAVEALESEYASKFSDDVDEITAKRSRDFGIAIAEAIYEWSKSDGGHQGYLVNFPASYTAPQGPGFWVPTPPAYQNALQPYWGNNRSFITDVVLHTQPSPPLVYSTSPVSPFYAQALEVYTVVGNLTPEQLLIAKYWSDDPGKPGTPPGHSISVTSQVLKKENANLALAAEAYCKVGIAVADAFITCWKCKFVYNLLRPVTYIQANLDPNWNPVLTTPPFPEYTSGHSVQTAAAAQVLSDLFGYNYTFTDVTHVDRTDINGAPRSFNSFFDMAEEAAISRLYGGIHYRDAIDLGILQGKALGEAVRELPMKK